MGIHDVLSILGVLGGVGGAGLAFFARHARLETEVHSLAEDVKELRKDVKKLMRGQARMEGAAAADASGSHGTVERDSEPPEEES